MSLDLLTDPWASGLMRRAFAEAVLAGALCGALGCFVLVRGLAFLGEGLAHTLLLGVVVAFLLGVPLGLPVALAAALTVAGASVIAADRRFSADVAMGVLLPSLFGLGVVLVAFGEGVRGRLEDALFGSILGVTGTDLLAAGAVAAVTAAVLVVAGKELVLASFDRATAAAMGYRVGLLDLVLLGLVAAAVVVGLRAVGNVLLAALLLGPPATARLLTRTFWPMAATAAGLGALGGVGGLYLSWHADVGAGPAIVLVLAGAFVLVALGSRLMLRRVLIKEAVAGSVLVALAAAGCADQGGDEAAGGAERLDVVATTMVLGDFARQVGGDRVRVTGLLGPDADPHEYEPTPSDADAVADADLVVENGAGLDDWLGDLLDTAGADAPRVTAVEGVELLPSEEEGFAGDPHVWHDPGAARRMVDAIAAGLAAADPAGRATYTANAARYGRELERMARRIRTRFAPIPPERRRLVTTHDAFGYFARAYDVDVVGSVLPSVTTETEPSARQVDALVRDLRRLEVRTIFTEEAVDPRLERQIAAEAGAEVSTSLYADVLAAEGPESTFVGAELANAEAMASAWEAAR